MFVHKNIQKNTFLSAYADTCTAKSPPLGQSLISVSPTLCPYWGGGGGGGVGPNIDRCISNTYTYLTPDLWPDMKERFLGYGAEAAAGTQACGVVEHTALLNVSCVYAIAL